jgi:hypothetical protein
MPDTNTIASDTVTPLRTSMESTPGDLITHHPDGRMTTTAVYIVHAPGQQPPAEVHTSCAPGCEHRS